MESFFNYIIDDIIEKLYLTMNDNDIDLSILQYLYATSFTHSNKHITPLELGHTLTTQKLRNTIFHKAKDNKYFQPQNITFGEFPYCDTEMNSYVAVRVGYNVDADGLCEYEEFLNPLDEDYVYFPTFVFINTSNFNVCLTGCRGRSNIVLFNIKRLFEVMELNVPDDDYLKSYFSNRPFSYELLEDLLYELIQSTKNVPFSDRLLSLFGSNVNVDLKVSIRNPSLEIIKSFIYYVLIQGYHQLSTIFSLRTVYSGQYVFNEWKYLPILIDNKHKINNSPVIGRCLSFIFYTMFNSVKRGDEVRKLYELPNIRLLKKLTNNYNNRYISFLMDSYKDFIYNHKLLTTADVANMHYQIDTGFHSASEQSLTIDFNSYPINDNFTLFKKQINFEFYD